MATTPTTMTTTNLSLATHFNDLFDNFLTNRKSLQEKWQRNYDAVNGISSEYWKAKEATGWRSNTFVNVTRQKVQSAHALLVDLMLQRGKIPFDLDIESHTDLVLETLPKDKQDQIRDDLSNAKSLIEQQLEDCHADRAMINHILSGTTYGETYAKRTVTDIIRKGYERKGVEVVPEITDVESLNKRYATWQKFEKKLKSPAWEFVSVWEIFRDLEEDNLFNGTGVFQRKLGSPYSLREMRNKRGWIPSIISQVLSLAEASGSPSNYVIDSASLPPNQRDISKRENTIERREYWGRAPRDKVEEFEEWMKQELAGKGESFIPPIGEPELEKGDDVEVVVHFANQEIVGMRRIKNSDRPFYRCVWQIDLDGTSGSGTADNVEDSQLVFNGAVRAFEDNKKLSGNIIMATKERYFERKVEEITPGMVIPISEDCQDARQALQSIHIPDTGASLMDLIGLFQGFLDEESMIPRISQGRKEEGDATAFEVSAQLDKAGKYIGAVIRNYDEGLIEPIISSFFDYNMNDPDVQTGKGNFVVKPLGFTAYQNKLVIATAIREMIVMASSNPLLAQEADFRSMFTAFAKATGVDPDQFLKSIEAKEEQMRMEQEMQANSPQSQLAIAQAQADIAKTQAEAQSQVMKGQMENQKLALEARKIEMEAERLKIEKAKLVADIRDKARQRGPSTEELRKKYAPAATA